MFFQNSIKTLSRTKSIAVSLILEILKNNLTVHEKDRWSVDINKPCIDGHTCTKNTEKSTISLQFIEQMWSVYENRPKLVFLNVMAAHDN
jgi:hypothetical protein